jgi:hypothetical protein
MSEQVGEVVAPAVPEGISDAERERIMEDAVRTKYAMVDQLQAEASAIFPPSQEDFGDDMPVVDSVFSEGANNPILEKERVLRLAKQQRAMEGGGDSSFRRSG